MKKFITKLIKIAIEQQKAQNNLDLLTRKRDNNIKIRISMKHVSMLYYLVANGIDSEEKLREIVENNRKK